MEWLPLVGGIVSSLFGGGGGGGGSSQAANRLAESQIANQTKILDYLMGKREKLYDPLEEQELVPRLKERMQTTPFYAGDWLKQARNLRTPMRLQ